MKKEIKITLIVLGLFLFIVGIIGGIVVGLNKKNENNNYKDFKHYDLSNHNYKEFEYVRDNSKSAFEIEKETYAVATLSEKDEVVEGYDEGLFYKIDENDYILIDTYNGDSDIFSNYTKIYKNKLYLVRGFGIIYEFTLNKEKTTKKQLNFNYEDIHTTFDGEHNYTFSGHIIDKITDDYIFFSNVSIGNTNERNINIKCSLKDLVCERLER